jgi:hypothetical protein
MIGFLRHYRIRLLAVLSDPYALFVFLFTALASLLYWPGLMEPAALDGLLPSDGEGLNEAFILIIWLFSWPIMVGNTAGGTVAAGGREALAQRPMPSLPVGTRTRMLAEACLVLTFVFIVRMPSYFAGEMVHVSFYLPGLLDAKETAFDAFVARTFYGTLVMLPVILVWTAPAQSPQVYFLVRPTVMIAAIFTALELGLLATPSSCIVTCGVLTAAAILLTTREFTAPRVRKRSRGSAQTRWRPGMDPEIRLRRDFWLRPLPWIAFFLALELFLFLFDSVVGFPEWGLYFCSSLVFGFMLSFVAMRPMALYFIDMGLVGNKRSGRDSDAGRGWVILPVRREAVTRGIYVHGLVMGTLIWGLCLLSFMTYAWLKTGEFRIVDEDGDSLAKYMAPYIVLVPCLAGGLVNAAAGDWTRGGLTLASTIAIFISHTALLVTKAPPALHVGVLVLLVLLGGAPAWTHMRSREMKYTAPSKD